MVNLFTRLKKVNGEVVLDYSPYKQSYFRIKKIRPTQIPVQIKDNSEDYEYVWIDRGDGKWGASVF